VAPAPLSSKACVRQHYVQPSAGLEADTKQALDIA
tara:strand:- start:152 stop:256 length:105 start_codon:yes stop_codon:yes gene_type:complete